MSCVTIVVSKKRSGIAFAMMNFSGVNFDEGNNSDKERHQACSLELKRNFIPERESSFVLYICSIMRRSRDVGRCSLESIFTAELHWHKVATDP
eukprot:3057154-Ditylum_brightwellii.AAC.1